MNQKLYTNGTILTMDEDLPQAGAVLVEGGMIAAVGTREALTAQAPAAEIVDLAGQTLLPGFIDSHSHMVFSCLFPRFDAPPAGTIDSVDALVAAIRAWLDAHPVKGDAWLVGMGYDHTVFADGQHPTRWDLDRASGEVPIVMMHASGHVGCANSKVLEICGITRDTPDPEGGIYVRDPATGEPNGMMEEAALLKETLGKMPLPTPEFMMEGVLRAEHMYLRNGITTAQDGSFSLDSIPLVAGLHQMGRSKIDLYTYPKIDLLAEGDAARILRSAEAIYENGVKVAGVKFFLDGSPQAKTAWLSAPYYIVPEGEPEDYRGYPVQPDDDVVCGYFRQCLKNGWQILVHCNGDAAIDQFIDQYARAQKETGITEDLRPVVVHCQTVREDQLDRMQAIGMRPTFFHDHVYLWGDLHLDSVLGPERGRRISPLASCEKRGMRYTLHQDTPVIEPNMILSLHHAVNRRTRSGRPIGVEYAVTPLQALRALTIHAAHQIFEEDSKGSITAGKRADLVILDKDPTKVAPETIKDIRVMQTIKDGEAVYER